MSTPFLLTRAPITVSAVGFQPIYLAVDVSAFDSLSVLAGCNGLTGTSPSFSLQLWTGMQNQTNDGWVQYGGTLSFSATDNWSAFNTTNITPLRYLRWYVSAIAGSTATFFISGEGSSYSGTNGVSYARGASA